MLMILRQDAQDTVLPMTRSTLFRSVTVSVPLLQTGGQGAFCSVHIEITDR